LDTGERIYTLQISAHLKLEAAEVEKHSSIEQFHHGARLSSFYTILNMTVINKVIASDVIKHDLLFLYLLIYFTITKYIINITVYYYC